MPPRREKKDAPQVQGGRALCKEKKGVQRYVRQNGSECFGAHFPRFYGGPPGAPCLYAGVENDSCLGRPCGWLGGRLITPSRGEGILSATRRLGESAARIASAITIRRRGKERLSSEKATNLSRKRRSRFGVEGYFGREHHSTQALFLIHGN